MSDQTNGVEQSGMGDNPAQGNEDRYTDALLAAANGIDDADEGEADPALTGDAGDEAEDRDGADPDDDLEAVEDEPDADDGDDADPEQGTLLHADYTRKTQALAEERRQFAQEREQFTQERDEVVTYGQNVQAAVQRVGEFLAGLIPPEPNAALAQTNPGQYVAQQASRQAALAELQALMETQGDVGQHEQAFDAASVERTRKAEADALLKALPDLRDPAKKAKFDADVLSAAKGAGFTEDDVSAVMDHRMLLVLRKAAIGERAIQNRENAKRRLAEAPKRGGEGRAAPPPNAPSKAMQRLRETHSDKDADRAIAAILSRNTP